MKVSAVRHPLEALGLVRIDRGDIRAEHLSLRTDPAVPFPHRHDFYQLLWVQRGSGWHEIDFERVNVHAGQLFVMKPGQVHSWKLSAHAEGVIIEFSSESLKDPGLEDLLMRIPDILDFKSNPEFTKQSIGLLTSMLKEFREQKGSYKDILASYLNIFILSLARAVILGKRRSLVKDPMISQFQNLVEKHFRDQHGLEFYCRLLGISPRALTMRLGRHVKKSGRQIIFDRLLLEAQRMLAYSEEPVASIGYALGFEDPNHFSRFFRQQAGMNALVFRQKNQR